MSTSATDPSSTAGTELFRGLSDMRLHTTHISDMSTATSEYDSVPEELLPAGAVVPADKLDRVITRKMNHALFLLYIAIVVLIIVLIIIKFDCNARGFRLALLSPNK